MGVTTYLEYPNSKQAGAFIVFEKTGSQKRNRLVSGTFAFQSYADSLYKAAELNNLVKKAVEDLEWLPEIASVKLSSDYNFTDTEMKKYRYQAVFEIKYYEE
ncbi:hypothetical protein [Aerococcus tenax]